MLNHFMYARKILQEYYKYNFPIDDTRYYEDIDSYKTEIGPFLKLDDLFFYIKEIVIYERLINEYYKTKI